MLTTQPRWYITDGGLETDLIFHHGVELPSFAAFVLYDTAAGRRQLRDYFHGYASIARHHHLGLRLESATWRASAQWGAELGYGAADLAHVNRAAGDLFRALRSELTDLPDVQTVGMIGPRGDGYRPGAWTDWQEAARYHLPQVRSLADAGFDLVCAYTLTCLAEAIGVVIAARMCAVPVGISFTVEPDGTLPDGTPLTSAIRSLDAVAPPDELLLNCAHPSHMRAGITDTVRHRVTGIRPNASRCTHAELDEAPVLDEGDIHDLAHEVSALAAELPSARVIGGCCGTDARHVAEMWAAIDRGHSDLR